MISALCSSFSIKSSISFNFLSFSNSSFCTSVSAFASSLCFVISSNILFTSSVFLITFSSDSFLTNPIPGRNVYSFSNSSAFAFNRAAS
jgi:hypothetical protein